MKNILKSPFNYTGSKANLMEQLTHYFPKDCNVCYDLFCGGGGFFINSIPYFEKIIANDIITQLTDCYKWLQRTEWPEISKVLNKRNINKNSKEEYSTLRDRFNSQKDFIDFFILVCSCTNNMMRFNKKLQFNQTWGKRNFNKSTEQKLKLYHEQLYQNGNIEFLNKNYYDFSFPLDSAPFIYLDPPYMITEAGYNSYWSKDLERRLYDFIDGLNDKNIKFMLSNVREHKGKINQHLERISKYKIIELDFNYDKVARNKSHNKSKEIVIINY